MIQGHDAVLVRGAGGQIGKNPGVAAVPVVWIARDRGAVVRDTVFHPIDGGLARGEGQGEPIVGEVGRRRTKGDHRGSRVVRPTQLHVGQPEMGLRHVAPGAVGEEEPFEPGDVGADLRQVHRHVPPMPVALRVGHGGPAWDEVHDPWRVGITHVLEDEAEVLHPGGIRLEVNLELDGPELVQVEVVDRGPVRSAVAEAEGVPAVLGAEADFDRRSRAAGSGGREVRVEGIRAGLPARSQPVPLEA